MDHSDDRTQQPDLTQSPPGRPRRTTAADVITIGRLYLAGRDDDDDAPVAVYAHGVASGDRRTDGVSLRTRITTAVGALAVDWELADDPRFTGIVARGQAVTDVGRDFCVEVHAVGLEPDTLYWYRFAVGRQRSPVGRTRTLPCTAECRNGRVDLAA